MPIPIKPSNANKDRALISLLTALAGLGLISVSFGRDALIGHPITIGPVQFGLLWLGLALITHRFDCIVTESEGTFTGYKKICRSAQRIRRDDLRV